MNIGDSERTQREKLSWLRDAIQQGLDDLEAERIEDGRTVMARIRQQLLERNVRKEGENEH